MPGTFLFYIVGAKNASKRSYDRFLTENLKIHEFAKKATENLRSRRFWLKIIKKQQKIVQNFQKWANTSRICPSNTFSAPHEKF